jgi:hypothetical protein
LHFFTINPSKVIALFSCCRAISRKKDFKLVCNWKRNALYAGGAPNTEGVIYFLQTTEHGYFPKQGKSSLVSPGYSFYR